MRYPRIRPRRKGRAYAWTFYSAACGSENPPVCIPLRAYCEKYGYSRYKVLKMLQKKRLCALTRKHRLFVEDRPPRD